MSRLFYILIYVSFLVSCKQEVNTLKFIPPQISALDSIRNEVIELVKSGHINSFSVAVIHKDKTLWKESFHKDKNDSTNVVITDNQIYPIASLTKSITAVLAHRLAEKGYLALDDDVDKYLGKELEFLSGKGVKIRDLITMKGGVPHGWIFINPNGRFNNLDDYSIYNLFFTSALPIGTYEYSNFSYGILESVLEKATGEKFHYLMEKEIFNPLKMSNASMQIDPNSSDSQYIKNAKRFSFYPKGGAGVYASLNDLINYSKLHLGKHQEVISNKSLNAMHYSKDSKSEIMAEGIGNITLNNNETWLVSNGSFSFPIESNSNLSILPNEEIAIICLADKDYQSSADIMAIKIADVFVPDFKKNAFKKMELYEKRNNKPFEVKITKDLLWEGTISFQGKKDSLFLSYSDNILKYSYDNFVFNNIENLRMDNQNIIRGNIELFALNPLTNNSGLSQSDINITINEDNKVIQGYISIPFQEENEYVISVPATLNLSLINNKTIIK